MADAQSATRPPSAWPNYVTLLRIVLVGPFIWCLLHQHAPAWRLAGGVLFAVTALTDTLDGVLARVLKSQTPLGRFLDPLADKLLITSAMILLAVDATAVPGKVVPTWVVIAAIGKDLVVVVGFALLYVVTGRITIQPRALGKTCTGAQLLMVPAVLFWPEIRSLGLRWLALLPDVLWWAGGLLAIAAAVDYAQLGIRLAHAEDGLDHEA